MSIKSFPFTPVVYLVMSDGHSNPPAVDISVQYTKQEVRFI